MFVIGVFFGILTAFKIVDPATCLMAIAGTVAIPALLIATKEIMWEQFPMPHAMKILWVLAFIVGLYVITLSGCRYIILHNKLTESSSIDWQAVWHADVSIQFVLGFFLLLVQLGPIFLSYLLRAERLRQEYDREEGNRDRGPRHSGERTRPYS